MVYKEEGGTGAASDGSRRMMGAVTPGKPVTLYKTGVGYNKTKKHTAAARLSRAQKSLKKR